MPHYAHLDADLRCPACGAAVATPTGLLWFQWGYCPSYQPVDGHIYRLGDAVRWRSCADGSTPAWTAFRRRLRPEPPSGGSNIGDPAVPDVVVRDLTQFQWEDESQRRRCGACGGPLEGALIEIRDGAIRRAWIHRPGEVAAEADYFLPRPDGSVAPAHEWTGHRMAQRDEC